MAKQPKKTSIERRRFLQQGALAGAALVGAPAAAAAQAASPAGTAPQAATATATQAPPPLTHAVESAEPEDIQILGENERAGSDFMIDVFKSLGFEYFFANP